MELRAHRGPIGTWRRANRRTRPDVAVAASGSLERTATATEPLVVPQPVAVADPSAAPTLAETPRLVAELEQLGHVARLTDRTDGRVVPVAVSREAYAVLRASVDVLARRASTGQQVHVRTRTEHDELVVSMQSIAAEAGDVPLRLRASDLQPLRDRIEAAGGRTTVRTTAGGNWIAIARLPMHPEG